LTLGKQTAQLLERNVRNVTRKDTMQGVCKTKGDKKEETPHDPKKTTAGAHHFTINRMKMSEKYGKISRVSQLTQNLIKSSKI
jgi:hypothetical protein